MGVVKAEEAPSIMSHDDQDLLAVEPLHLERADGSTWSRVHCHDGRRVGDDRRESGGDEVDGEQEEPRT